jgi:hypothetical protein
VSFRCLPPGPSHNVSEGPPTRVILLRIGAPQRRAARTQRRSYKPTSATFRSRSPWSMAKSSGAPQRPDANGSGSGVRARSRGLERGGPSPRSLEYHTARAAQLAEEPIRTYGPRAYAKIAQLSEQFDVHPNHGPASRTGWAQGHLRTVDED